MKFFDNYNFLASCLKISKLKCINVIITLSKYSNKNTKFEIIIKIQNI